MLAADDLIKDAIGAKLYSAFYRAKEEEWEDYRIHVTDWEEEHYLESA
jgi:glutamine synthetase